MDLDATVIESQKQEAWMTYLGDKGYQPVTVYWAEEDLILADEFRDGNVPAEMDLLGCFRKPSPPCLRRFVWSGFVRIQRPIVHDLLNWCRKEMLQDPRIEFAISADMTEELRAAIQALPRRLEASAKTHRSGAH